MAWRKGKANNFKFYTTTYIYAAHFNHEEKKRALLMALDSRGAAEGICTVGVLFVPSGQWAVASSAHVRARALGGRLSSVSDLGIQRKKESSWPGGIHGR